MHIGNRRGVWRLHVVACPDRRWAGRIAILFDTECRVGRDVHGETELCIEDAALSREHATLAVTGVGVVVRDTRSRNGT